MSIMVIYESFYGNTEQIAQAVAQTVGAELCRVDAVDWDRLQAANIVIFGCPTRAFHASEGMGKFLKGLEKTALEGKQVSAFDTRMDVEQHPSKMLRFMAHRFGYAANKIQKQLIAKGGEELGEPAWFLVDGMEGPLHEGEIDRAKEWAKKLIQ